jgi:sulfonate transport system substrate-binding protein
LLTSAMLAGMLPAASLAADKPKTINIDWATYNPVSMVLKDKGLLEKEFAKDAITVRWVKTVSSSNALQFLNAGSIDFGSTAGSAALVARINGNPIKAIYTYSRPEWTALVTAKDSKVTKVADLKGKKVAMVRGTDPHIFAVRALLAAGLDPMMAQHEVQDGARLFYRKPEANTWGILNAREEFLKDHPDVVRRVLAVYEEARKYSLANYPELKKVFIGVTGLADAVVDKQLKERTGLTFNRVGPEQRESILEAGIALQKGGVIKANVDVKKAVDDLIDGQYVTVTN